jgi:hypothetical protein
VLISPQQSIKPNVYIHLLRYIWNIMETGSTYLNRNWIVFESYLNKTSKMAMYLNRIWINKWQCSCISVENLYLYLNWNIEKQYIWIWFGGVVFVFEFDPKTCICTHPGAKVTIHKKILFVCVCLSCTVTRQRNMQRRFGLLLNSMAIQLHSCTNCAAALQLYTYICYQSTIAHSSVHLTLNCTLQLLRIAILICAYCITVTVTLLTLYTLYN